MHMRLTTTRLELHDFPDSLLDLIDERTSYLGDSATQTDAKVLRLSHVDAEQVWDGYVRLLRRNKVQASWVPSGLRHRVFQVLQEAGTQCSFEDKRAWPYPEAELLDRYPDPISLREHQEQCAAALDRDLDGVADMPPRAGKTRTMFEYVRRKAVPVLWVAPTTAIVDQTVKAAREWFKAEDVCQVTSKNQLEASSRFLTVCTAGALFNLRDDFLQSRKMLVCDEAHHYLSGKGWGGFLDKHLEHISLRKGMTGTHFRSGNDGVAMEGFLGPKLFGITSKELEDKGYLVPCYSAFINIPGPMVRIPKPKEGGTPPRTFNGPFGFGTWGIAKHGYRNDVTASVAKLLSDTGRSVLILVGLKKQGYEVQKRLETMFPSAGTDIKPVEFVSTDKNKGHVRAVLDSFRNHGDCKVLIGTSMISEGTDLPVADALVYAAGGKAAVSLTQAWYRVITKTETKRYSVIIDFADQHHRGLYKHAKERWNIMAEDPIFRMSYCPTLEHFQSWAQHLAPWSLVRSS